MKKNYKNSKTITTVPKTIDTFIVVATTSSSITLSLTGIGLTVIPKSTATACGLSIGNKLLPEIVMQKYNYYKKHYEKDQQINKSFDILYR